MKERAVSVAHIHADAANPLAYLAGVLEALPPGIWSRFRQTQAVAPADTDVKFGRSA